MKTKEELNALKKEVETINKILAELNEDELKQVTGGATEPINIPGLETIAPSPVAASNDVPVPNWRENAPKKELGFELGSEMDYNRRPGPLYSEVPKDLFSKD